MHFLKSQLLRYYLYSEEGFGRGEQICDEKHVTWFLFCVFDHLDFGVKGEIKVKLVCLNIYLSIYDNFIVLVL